MTAHDTIAGFTRRMAEHRDEMLVSANFDDDEIIISFDDLIYTLKITGETVLDLEIIRQRWMNDPLSVPGQIMKAMQAHHDDMVDFHEGVG